MKFLKNKNNNNMIIVFLIAVIILTHLFAIFALPKHLFIKQEPNISAFLPLEEPFVVNATLLDTDGKHKLDAKGNPQMFQIDICGNDPNFKTELSNQINSYVKTAVNTTVVPAMNTVQSLLNNNFGTKP